MVQVQEDEVPEFWRGTLPEATDGWYLAWRWYRRCPNGTGSIDSGWWSCSY